MAKNWLLQTRQYLHLILVEELWQRPENCHNYLGMNTEKYINLSKITSLIDKQGIYTTMKFLLVKGPLQP